MYFNEVYMTCGIQHLMEENNILQDDINHALFLMINNDWGELCEEDRILQNNLINNKTERFIGVYRSLKGFRFWLINEFYSDKRGRIVTFLLPEEY